MALAGSACAQQDANWEWMLEPYAWAASVGTDLRTNVPPIEGESDLAFRDILDRLDGVFQLRLEGRGDRVGMFADFTYLGLADNADGRIATTRADLDTRLFEVAGVWIPGGGRDRGLDLFAGIRYLDVDLGVAFEPHTPGLAGRTLSSGGSYTDAMLGARYTWAPSQRWRLTARGDASFGDTEGMWNASFTTQYRTARGAWLFGYRHLEIEVETGDAGADFVMSGPTVGYGFRF